MLVTVPRPEHFAVHKLIVSGRRAGPHRAKAEKDLAEARALVDVLAEARPEELARAWCEARREGAHWTELLDKALIAEPAIRARIEHVSDN